MRVDEGQSARGIFGGSNYRRRSKTDSLARFADLLSEHIDEADLAAGRGHELDRGGDVSKCARRMGLKPQSGNGMLHRIRQRLGPQAC